MMPSPCSQSQTDSEIKECLSSAGYTSIERVTKTLQGSVWRSQKDRGAHIERCVAKATEKTLHKNCQAIVRDRAVACHENIKKEAHILSYLSSDPKCPASIVKARDFLESANHYLFVMDDGGNSLFDFTVKAHSLLSRGVLRMSDWHALVKVMFAQMLESIEYVHSKSCCHYDISLENWLINDINIERVCGEHIRFVLDDPRNPVRVRLCDFGLAERFPSSDERCMSQKFCGKTNYKSPEVTARKAPFSAKSNDVWCLGCCLFMLMFGSSPWHKTDETDAAFKCIMNVKEGLTKLLLAWQRAAYIDKQVVDLLNAIFKTETERATLHNVKDCEWLSV